MPTQVLALGAQMVLCAAALLVATSAVVRRATGRGLGEPLAGYLGLHGLAADDFTSLFGGASQVSMTELISGLAVGVVFGTCVAATQQRAFESLGSLPPAGWRESWRWFAWMAGLLLYLFVVLNVGQLGHHTDWPSHLGALTRVLAQVAASSAFYWWSQHLLLQGRVAWVRLLPGAIVISLGTTVLVLTSGFVYPDKSLNRLMITDRSAPRSFSRLGLSRSAQSF